MTVVARRAGWGFLDQVLSSATNFAFGILVAAVASPDEFGAFSLVYGVYSICIGLSAGLASNPLVVRFSAAGAREQREAQTASVGTALVLGLLGGTICVGVALILGSSVTTPLLVLGLLLPGLLVQDAWRFAFMARARPAQAAVNDAAWAVLQVIGTGTLLALHAVSAATLVLVWGGAATIAGALGCVQAGTSPAPRQARRWLAAHRDLGPRLALESVAHRSGAWLAVAAVGAIAGLSAVAALRGALLLVTGPLNLLFVGAAFVAVPETVRLLESTPEKLQRLTWTVSGAIAAVSAGWCIVVLALAPVVGSRLLGETWPLARPLLLTLTFFAVAQALSIGPAQSLWAMAAAVRSLRCQLANVLLMLVTTAAGAAIDGARGAAAGLVATGVLSVGIWSWQFRRGAADWTTSASATPTASAEPASASPERALG